MSEQQLNIDQALELALEHHRGGNFQQAELIYRQILAAHPNHPDALHLLGLIAFQAGQADPAIQLIRQSIAAHPGSAAYHEDLGRVLLVVGRAQESIESYEQALRLDPGRIDSMHNLALALHQVGRLDESLRLFQKVLEVQSQNAEAHLNYGNLLRSVGRKGEALEQYRLAKSLNPKLSDARNNLGAALREIGQTEQAIAELRSALTLQPDSPLVHNNLGLALREQGNIDAALRHLDQAIALYPNYPEAQNNRGDALQSLGRVDEAIAAYRRALSLQPNYAAAKNNLGSAYKELGQFDLAVKELNQALAIEPHNAAVQYNLGTIELLHGNLPAGFSQTESQRRANSNIPAAKDIPEWDGAPLNRRRLVIYAEQGLGDTIHMVRYLPWVQKMGGDVVLAVQPALVRLLRSMKPAVNVIARDEPWANSDLACSLLRLPQLFKTTLDRIPAPIPYLFAEPELVQFWRGRVEGKAFKVGLVWAGRPEYRHDRQRSIELKMLAPLEEVPNVTPYSLQKGAAAIQAGSTPFPLIDLAAELNDFSDTAALIENLDLIITVDTAVAHLAGAMGKPVWTMLPFMPDWRWMLTRTDSPWYPTMRLFRQSQRGQWDSVVRQIADALKTASRT